MLYDALVEQQNLFQKWHHFSKLYKNDQELRKTEKELKNFERWMEIYSEALR